MNQEQDAYGSLMWAYYRGEEVYEILERDDGFITATNMPRLYFSTYSDWAPYVRKAIKYVKGDVLDVGCGSGRHCLYLQENGFKVTGIDSSPLAIRLCRKRGVEDARCLAIDSLGELEPDRFNTVLMLGNNFGLFGSRDKAISLLDKMAKLTTRHAHIIAESNDPYPNARQCDRDYHSKNRARGQLPGQMRIRIRFENITSDWFDYLFVSKDEMKEIVDAAGWRIDQFIDNGGSSFIGIIEKARGSTFFVRSS